MKEPKPKHTVMAGAILIAIAALAVDKINWRDALLIVTGPLALYHLFCVYILSITKHVPPLQGPKPHSPGMEIIKKHDIQKFVCYREITPDELMYSKAPKTLDDFKKEAAREFGIALRDFITVYEKAPDPEYRNQMYSFELEVVDRRKKK